ncbi:hypothetical protein DIPPA_12041 [Diplonema papillatum]|nr:hypothetical protein DIPPA_12041 [Diplonema papillatum]
MHRGVVNELTWAVRVGKAMAGKLDASALRDKQQACLIRKLAARGGGEEARDVYRAAGSPADVVLTTARISASTSVDEGLALLDQLKHQGAVVDSKACIAVLRLCFTCASGKEADRDILRVFAAMRTLGVRPNGFHYAMTLKILLRWNMQAASRRVWKEACEASELTERCLFHYTCFLDANKDHAEAWIEADRFWEHFFRVSMEPAEAAAVLRVARKLAARTRAPHHIAHRLRLLEGPPKSKTAATTSAPRWTFRNPLSPASGA